MLHKVQTLVGYTLTGFDGEMGKIKELYFDDQYWTIRYLVAETGNWLSDRQVLISPYALGAIHKDLNDITIGLTKKQIEDSPAISNDKPVSRQFESEYYGYYGWPPYFGGPFMWGMYPVLVRDPEKWGPPTHEKKAWDPHLRSTQDVTGHNVQASDGEIGHIEDFLVDDEAWAIRFFIIDTQNWWPGKKVLISPQWIERISWNEEKVFTNLSRDSIRQSPEFTDESLVNRNFEIQLHRHYNRQGYWAEEPKTSSAKPLQTQGIPPDE